MKVRFKQSIYGTIPHYYCMYLFDKFCSIDHTGDYYPAADYEALKAENAEMINLAGEAIGTDPEYRSSACVKALADWNERILADRNALLRRVAGAVSDVQVSGG